MSRDTPLEVEIELDRLFAKRSGSKRVRMACEMFDAARVIAIGAIRSARPGISDAELRVELFDRLYGDDVDSEQQRTIRERLASGAGMETIET